MADQASDDPIRTIVAATDFSDTAEGAIEWAAHLARAHRAKLVLFHALVPPPAAAPEFVPLPPELYVQQQSAATAHLKERAAVLGKSGIDAQTDLLAGPTVGAILDAAERWKADLLAVGTRGLTGWKRLLLGSTTARIVREATCPVLSVHPEPAAKHRPVRRILIPTDFSEDAGLALSLARRVLGPSVDQSTVLLLHVYRVPTELMAPWPGPILVDTFEKVATDARAELEKLAAPLRALGLTVDVAVREGYPAEVIDEEARVCEADVIAMGTHGRSGVERMLLGSTAERVLPHAPCPVLTARRPKAE